MIALQVTAKIRGAIAIPNGPIALDGLLAWAVAVRDDLPPVLDVANIAPIEIPVAREPGGRFHLSTWSFARDEVAELRYVNRRFPMQEAQDLGEAKIRRINIQGGPCKSYRLPLATAHLERDELTWWCVGDAEKIRGLLSLVTYLGKRRATGLGKVVAWSVEPCEPWGDGFPVVRDGQPMRPLPRSWPGLAEDVETAYKTITYPYWRRADEELCAVPASP